MSDSTAQDNLIVMLLREWGMDDVIISNFLENNVDEISLFPKLIEEPRILKELVPNIFKRVTLEAKIKEHLGERVASEGTSSAISTFSNDRETISDDVNNGEFELLESTLLPSESSTSNFESFEFVNDNNSAVNLKDNSDAVQSYVLCDVKRRKIEENNILDLGNLLNSTCIGRAIVQLYNIKKGLDSTCQSYLVDIIATHFLNNIDNFRRLNNNDFDKLSDIIITYFPREVKETYYIAPVRKNISRDHKSGIARGKLVDKYRNKLIFLRQARLVSNVNRNISTVAENTEPNDDVYNALTATGKDSITWLKNNFEPWSEVLEHWTKCYNERLKIYNSDANITKIYKEFPILNTPLGYNLIDKDFDKIFPGHESTLYDKFQSVTTNLISVRKKYLNDQDKLIAEIIGSENSLTNADYVHYLRLTLLSSLLPCKSRHVKKNKTQWKPSNVESREGMIVRVELPADVSTTIENKREKMRKYKLTLQPFIIVEGQNTQINNIYVSVNDNLYMTTSMLKAIDICFRAFHVFNLRYPFEAEHIWQYIQWAIYNIKTKNDNQIPYIYDIVNKTK